MNEVFTLRQAGQMLGIPTYTLRKFCSKGLLRGVRRQGNYRVLNKTQIEEVRLMSALLSCGMNWNELKLYMKFERAGDETIERRKAMLETKKRQLWVKMKELQESIDFIERKEEIMDGIIGVN